MDNLRLSYECLKITKCIEVCRNHKCFKDYTATESYNVHVIMCKFSLILLQIFGFGLWMEPGLDTCTFIGYVVMYIVAVYVFSSCGCHFPFRIVGY